MGGVAAGIEREDKEMVRFGVWTEGVVEMWANSEK